MICQHCGTMPAKVNIIEKINGETHEHHLCTACAEELTQRHLQNAFGSVLNGVAGHTAVKKNITRQCAGCGLTQQAFARDGRAGCPQCYQAFGGVLQPMLSRSQGGLKHTGKKPDDDQPTQQPAAAQPTAAQQLQQQLQQAVADENYEQAAVLRDQLRAMQEG